MKRQRQVLVKTASRGKHAMEGAVVVAGATIEAVLMVVNKAVSFGLSCPCTVALFNVINTLLVMPRLKIIKI